MSLISRGAVFAVVAAIGFAAPAFAQPPDRDASTIEIAYAPSSSQSARAPMHSIRRRADPLRHSGSKLFDMGPAIEDGGALSPALTGGGCVGYNENVRNDS